MKRTPAVQRTQPPQITRFIDRFQYPMRNCNSFDSSRIALIGHSDEASAAMNWSAEEQVNIRAVVRLDSSVVGYCI